ncbi:hypothetical protein GCM10011502_16920 [Oceanisphaera marina]|uniref:Uncharacterized protein n=1 Tax=Oceanisphaera marina TaxID=2017550 RepID=A0ABQ1IL02_9GAMM|nr:hypothetical protein GCM10011502_16920 [Oceanisphaera marina]
MLTGVNGVRIDGGKWLAPEETGCRLPVQNNIRKYDLKVIAQYDTGQGLGGITHLADDGAVLGVTT